MVIISVMIQRLTSHCSKSLNRWHAIDYKDVRTMEHQASEWKEEQKETRNHYRRNIKTTNRWEGNSNAFTENTNKTKTKTKIQSCQLDAVGMMPCTNELTAEGREDKSPRKLAARVLSDDTQVNNKKIDTSATRLATREVGLEYGVLIVYPSPSGSLAWRV